MKMPWPNTEPSTGMSLDHAAAERGPLLHKSTYDDGFDVRLHQSGTALYNLIWGGYFRVINL